MNHTLLPTELSRHKMVCLYHHQDKCYNVTSYGMGPHSFPVNLMTCVGLTILLWWRIRESNPWPSECKSDALANWANPPKLPFQPHCKLDYIFCRFLYTLVHICCCPHLKVNYLVLIVWVSFRQHNHRSPNVKYITSQTFNSRAIGILIIGFHRPA